MEPVLRVDDMMMRTRYPAEPNPGLFRLHCRNCGAALTRPMREFHPSAATPGSFRFGRTIAPSQRARPTQVDVIPGEREVVEAACFFPQDSLAGSALPLRWDTKSEGCCGPEATGGPNVLCHGCGCWALFYNETCYSPTFFAGRPTEVELRPVV